MPDIKDIFTLYTQLSPKEQKKLYIMISYQQPMDDDFEQFIKDERFTSGFVCPHCGCCRTYCKKWSHNKNRQRRK